MIMPTALSYSGYTALGAAFGKFAMAKVFNVTLRRGLVICFVMYGVLLGAASGYFVGALRVRVGFLNKLTAILFGGLAARLIID